MLDDRNDSRSKKSRGAHGLAGARHLDDLDRGSPDGDLHATPGPGSDDVERTHAVTDIDDDLDAVTTHIRQPRRLDLSGSGELPNFVNGIVLTVRPQSTEEVAVDGDALLRSVLDAHPGAPVSAIAASGRMTPLPSTIALGDHPEFTGGSGLHVVVADDQAAIVEAWSRAQQERHVRVDVHLLSAPDELATVHIIDARADHGVHVIVLEGHDLNEVHRSMELRSEQRRTVAHTKKDAVSVFLEVDEGTTALLGWDESEMVGRSTADFVHPDDFERALESWLEMRTNTGVSRVRLRMRHARGHYVWLEVANENRLDDPMTGCVVSEMTDISEEMRQLEALRDRERQLARLAEALPIGICHVRNDRRVVFSNEPLVALLGAVDHADGLCRLVAEGDRAVVIAALDRAMDGGASSFEVGIVDGVSERRCELTMRPMSDDDGRLDDVILCAADVTDRSRLRAALEHRASHDALTGCRNRAATVAAVESFLVEGRRVVVAFIDLNRFKATNDSFGHAAGDEVLRVTAARLRTVTREDDIVGRLGGDEFVVICPVQASVDVEAFAARLTDAINGTVVYAGRRIPLCASVGAAVSFEGEVDAEAVLQRADTAMYAAKRDVNRVDRASA